MKNSEDPDQLASRKPADLDLHYFLKMDLSGFYTVGVTIQFCLVFGLTFQSTAIAMVMQRRSVNLTTLFLCKLD